MVACHKPKNLKDLVLPSRMKDCVEPGLKASAYAETQIGKVEVVKVQDRANKIVLNAGVSMDIRDKVHKTFELVGRDIHYIIYKKKFVIRNREIADGSDLNVS